MKHVLPILLSLLLFSCSSKTSDTPFDQMEDFVKASSLYEPNTGDDFMSYIVKYKFDIEGANPSSNSMDYRKTYNDGGDLRFFKIFYVWSDKHNDVTLTDAERNIPKSLIFAFGYDGAVKAKQGFEDLKKFLSEKYPQAQVVEEKTEEIEGIGEGQKYVIQQGDVLIKVNFFAASVEVTFDKA